jgi:hypothetical protein
MITARQKASPSKPGLMPYCFFHRNSLMKWRIIKDNTASMKPILSSPNDHLLRKTAFYRIREKVVV